MLNNFQVKSLVLALLMANMGHGQPLQQDHAREQRQLKQGAMSGGAAAAAAAGTTEGNVQMMANVTPAMATMPMAMNQMQLARYPQLYYAGAGAYPLPVPGLQTNIANNYPIYPDGGFPGAFGVPPSSYPAGLMYPSPVFPPPPQQQLLPNGFVPQPSVDNYANLNNIVNMANIQGLQGATTTNGFYSPPPPATGLPVPGLYPSPPNAAAGYMPAYAPAF